MNIVFKQITVRDLVADYADNDEEGVVGYDGKLVFKKSDDKEYLTDNPNRRCPILDKARDHLGYSPTIDINEGLKRSLIWYKENAAGLDK